MRFAHLLARVTGTHWLITEPALDSISAILEARINGATDGVLAATADRSAPLAAAPGVAVIPIQGVIGKRLSAMEMACGGADVDAIAAAFDAANADANVSKIVLHIDSPGGTVTGVPELARHIYDSKTKPVEAVSDTLIGSAAYYIASAADSITVTPTAEVGSVGVVLGVRESTGQAQDGKRLRVFRSGADKMMGTDAPLTEEQAKALQERVDSLGAMFRGDVLKARPNVPAHAMTGLTYFGEKAVALHLADRVVPSLTRAD